MRTTVNNQQPTTNNQTLMSGIAPWQPSTDSAAISRAPAITITKAGEIAFNKSAVHAFDMTGKPAAIIGCDPKRGIIAIAPVETQTEAAIPLKKRSGGKGGDSLALKGVRGFLREFAIDHSETRRFPIHQDEESHNLYIEVGSPVTARRTRARRKAA